MGTKQTRLAAKQQVINIDANEGICTHCNILALLPEFKALKITALYKNTGTASMTKLQ